MKKIASILVILGLVLSATALTGTTAEAKKRGTTFENCDKNNDGFLSKQEYLACFPRSAAKFDAMDTAKAGKISKDDIKAYNDAKKAAKKSTGKKRVRKAKQAPEA